MENAKDTMETRKDDDPGVPGSNSTEEDSMLSKREHADSPQATIDPPTEQTASADPPSLESQSIATTSKSPPPTTSNSTVTLSAAPPMSPPPTPAKRRPKPPTKGILKPPPPPAKPTLTNKIRDIVMGSVNVVGGSARGLFEQIDPEASSSAGATYSGRGGPSMPNGNGTASSTSTIGAAGSGSAAAAAAVTAAVGGTLNAISGRFGLGLGRFTTPIASSSSTPSSSPITKSVSLPETGSLPMSEKSRQKQPLKKATFVLPSMSITYPISSQGEPWSQKVLEDRQKVCSHRLTCLKT